MKRLLTIFLSSLVGTGLWAQSTGVPMAIYGDVYNGGGVYSKGDVHVKAGTAADDVLGRVDNYGNLQVGTSNTDPTNAAVILYTNKTKDAVVRSGYEAAHATTVNTKGAAVRMTLEKKMTWYTISLPFDVKIADGISLVNTDGSLTPLTQGTGFQVQYYDSWWRSQTGLDQSTGSANQPSYWGPASAIPADRYTIWRVVGDPRPSDASSPTAGYPSIPNSGTHLLKGTGYRFILPTAVSAQTGNIEIQFTASDQTNANFAFNKANKPLTLYAYNDTPDSLRAIKYQDQNLDYAADLHSTGWNIIGGVNTDLFLLGGANSVYERAVYITEQDRSDWKEALPLAGTVGTFRPYATMFVKTTEAINSFTYNYSGNIIAKEAGLPTFRSANAYAFDLLELELTNSKGDATAKSYFKMNKSYSPFYKSEDDPMMSTAKSSEKLYSWSVAEAESGAKGSGMFVNALPYNYEKAIPVGVNIPAKGDYTFSLNQVYTASNSGLKSVILWDKEKNIKVELTKSDYKFSSDGSYNSESLLRDSKKDYRFVIYFNSTDVTGLDEMPDVSDVFAYAENNILTVRNLMPGDRVQVLDLTGRTIVSGTSTGNTYTASLSQKGVYIVNVQGGKTLRILNK